MVPCTGQIGANITLRDTTLPTDQAELDEFAQAAASRFAANGLTLFTQPDGTVPASAAPPSQNGYVGFSGTIQVNPAVQANPSAVRDGTPTIANPNPANPNNLAGFTGIISAVLNTVLGSNPPLGAHAVNLGPGAT
jgi:flagellar hook-associated protein 1